VDDLQSEKEQIEEMKAWWAEYRVYIISGVLIAVAGLLGYNHIQSSKLAAEMEASMLFEELAEHVFSGDLEDAEAVADDLANSYANTPYAAQSRLAMSRLYMDKNRDQDAADVLNELLAMRGNGALKHVGRVRLARILLYQDKAQEVIDLLADRDDEAFSGLYAELRGDAYAALGDTEAAGDAYRAALADTSQTVNRGLVQMKLVDLAAAQPMAAVPATIAPDVVETEAPVGEPVMDEEAGETE
jgi:predicted negative regulator of RcsB-dependent stress response